MPKEFLIFEAGVYPQGDYSNREVLTEFVNRFNNNKQRLPVFVGHKEKYEQNTEEDEFAHGEITELRINARGQIFATNYTFDDYLKSLIATKKVLSVSPEIVGDPQKQIDVTGVAFLGRTAPANFNTALPEFFERKEEGNTRVGNFSIKDIVRKFKYQEILKKYREEKNEESRAYFSKLLEKAKITPAVFDKVVEFDMKLPSELKSQFREIFEKLKPVVVLEKHTLDSKQEQPRKFSYQEIVKFQKQNNIATFEEAAKLLYMEVNKNDN